MFGMYLLQYLYIYIQKRQYIAFKFPEFVHICIKIARKALQFLTSFKLGNSILSTYTDTNLLHKYEHFFSWKLTF